MCKYVKAFELVERIRVGSLALEQYIEAHTTNELLMSFVKLAPYLSAAKFMLPSGALSSGMLEDFFRSVANGIEVVLMEHLGMPSRERLERLGYSPTTLLKAKHFDRRKNVSTLRFDLTPEGKEQSIKQISALIRSGFEVEGTDKQGNLLNFFMSECGTLCVGKRRGPAFNSMSEMVRRISVLPLMTKEERELQELKHSMEMTLKYKNRALRGSPLNLHYPTICRNANDWLTPSDNSLSCGSNKDGNVVTLKRVLNLMPSIEREAFKTALAAGTKYRSNHFKFDSFSGYVEIFEVATSNHDESYINVSLATEFKGAAHGHYYMLTNENEFMYVDSD